MLHIFRERMVLGCFYGWVWLQAWNSFWKSMLLLQDLKQVQRCFSVRALHLTLVLLSSCPHLSLRHAQLHQVPRGSNGDFGRSGVVRMPGGRWAQASHYLDEKGKESQLPALWGTTRELPVWSVWMCNTSLSHTFTAHYLSAFVWYRAAGHTLSFYRTYATCRSRRCVCI